MGSKTTLKDLAKTLAISVSTVSKALHDSPEISKPTKQRVKTLAKSLKYTPNQVAVNLKRNSTKSIGVVIPNILDEFFAMALDGIEKEASKNGYKVIICISNESLKKEKVSLTTLMNGSVDGIILSLARETQIKRSYKHLEDLKNQDCHLLMFDRTCDSIDCDKVVIDDMYSAQHATEYLLDTGCSNILFLSTIHGTSVGGIREQGYINTLALKANSQQPKISHIDSYAHFENLLTESLGQHEVDGILAADELSAIYAMQTVQMHGYKIPDDISIVGFTNGSMSKSSLPSLTTVSQHAQNIGKTTVQSIIKRIEKTYFGKPRRKIIKTELIARNSTKKITPERYEQL